MVSNRALYNIAGIGGIIIACTGYATHYVANKRLCESNIYKEALRIVHNHPKAVAYLGEPIKDKPLRADTKDDVFEFSISLVGSNTSGEVHCEMPLPKNIEDYVENISKLDIKFANLPNKTFVIKDTQTDAQ